MKTIGDRIRERRIELKMSQEELALALGYKSRSTINKIEKDGRELRQNKISDMAKVLQTTPAYLMGWEDARDDSTTQAVRINVYGSIPAGIPMEAIEDIEDWEDIPQAWTAGGKEYFGLKVKGDSMLPKFEDGDTIILRKTDQCESGQICAVYVNGYNATLKKVIITDQPAQIILQPLNADYDPMVYDYDPANPDYVRICGVVVEIRRSVNL